MLMYPELHLMHPLTHSLVMLTGDTEVALMTLMPNKYFDQTFYMVRYLPEERPRDSQRTRPAHNAAAYSATHRSFLLVAAIPTQDANDGDEPMPTAWRAHDVGRAG